MARFDVYRNPGKHIHTTPYLLDVQSNYLQGLAGRVVVPMRAVSRFPRVSLPQDLTPVFLIEGQQCFLDTPQLGAVPAKLLGSSIMSLAAYQDEITEALDRLFGAY